MKRTRLIHAGLVTLGLATAMHLDWHTARPAVHHFSLGWGWHWLLAVPVFALTAWYVDRAWTDRRSSASLAILGIASFLAAVVEPAWELWSGASLEWAFGRGRLGAFGAFLATGAITHAAWLWLASERRARESPALANARLDAASDPEG
jgi:hypothetical protein